MKKQIKIHIPYLIKEIFEKVVRMDNFKEDKRNYTKNCWINKVRYVVLGIKGWWYVYNFIFNPVQYFN